MKKTVALVGGLVMLVSGAVYAAATVPAGKETIKIDMIPGDKGAVEFPHAKHMTFKVGGKAVECKNCHHMLKGPTPAPGEAVAPCNSCHTLDTPKKIEGKDVPVLAIVKNGKAELKSVLIHKTCKDQCHKEVKTASDGTNLTSCNTCHKK